MGKGDQEEGAATKSGDSVRNLIITSIMPQNQWKKEPPIEDHTLRHRIGAVGTNLL